MTYVRSGGAISPLRCYWGIQAFDVCVTVAAFVLAFSLRTEFDFTEPDWLAMLVGIPIVFVLAWGSYHVIGLFRGTWSETTDLDFVVVVKGVSLVAMLLTGTMVVSNTMAEMPRSVPLIHWFITVVALCGSRIFWAWRQTVEKPESGTLALLIGCGQPAIRFLTSIQALSSGAYKIAALLDEAKGGPRVGRTIRGVPVVGHVDDIERCLNELNVHGVFPKRLIMMASLRDQAPRLATRLADVAKGSGLALDVIEDGLWWGGETSAAKRLPVKPILSVNSYMMWRRPLEVVVCVALLILLAPVFVLLAGLCLIDVGRPIFFWQMRPGRHLRDFMLIKFRTMRSGFDADGKPLSDEQRTSAIGRLIRRSKLDEIPQLFSILKGDMSFIGPRPLLPRDQPRDAKLRAIVRPGVTGWAQVNGGHPLNIEEKLALDIWYIQHASPALDLKILWLTFRTVLFGEQVNQAAISEAVAMHELMLPVVRQPDLALDEALPRAQTKPATTPVRPGVGGWWNRPVGSLDRAS